MIKNSSGIAFKEAVRRLPLIGRILVFLFRLRIAVRFLFDLCKKLLGWLIHSRELSNYTYDLSDLNVRHLASLLEIVLAKPHDEILSYIAELNKDETLRDHIRQGYLKSGARNFSDTEPKYARRVGWYAIARATKPKVVIETGIDKGLGSCVLAAALMKNAQEGFPGRYYGTDINPAAGFLFSGRYREYGEILYGDSIASLQKITAPIDLFINDSDHSAKYERDEYKTIASKLSENAIILGDNAHCTDALIDFAYETKRRFVFFSEKPKSHWYAGAGIGIAYTRKSTDKV